MFSIQLTKKLRVYLLKTFPSSRRTSRLLQVLIPCETVRKIHIYSNQGKYLEGDEEVQKMMGK